MAFRRRRRRPKVVWLPNPGTITNANDAIGVHSWSGIEIALDTSTAPNLNRQWVVELPMVQDVPVDPTGLPALSSWKSLTLERSEEEGYRLRRIVGELHVSGFSNAPFDPQAPFAALPPPAILITCGFIVRRVKDDGTTFAAATGPQEQYADSIDNNADPWIWRRSWVITNPQSQTSFSVYPDKLSQALAVNSPVSNWEYGSGNVGGKVDQKTARRVGAEERLMFNATLTPLPISFDSDAVVTGYGAYINFTYRVLGTVFTSAGNKRNASR